RGEDKIAAIGIRLRKWISWHGFAVNLDLDLAPFDAIIPCGIQPGRYGVTSLARLGRSVSYTQFDQALRKSFPGQVHHGNS
ncbi:MAG: lipoate-protein ligase B, partial [Pseudomonadota bacterium]